jgi:YgiT-type zinc finger domain-containing protein
MPHRPCHHTLGQSGHVQCPLCSAMNEAQVTNRDDTLHLVDGRTVVQKIPVWTCLRCKESWTDFVAEDIRERAVAPLNTPRGERSPRGKQRKRAQ